MKSDTLEQKVSGRRVVRLDWIESERGWGTRPDGYSLHLTQEDSKTYVKAYWDTMPDEVPDEYSRPDGPPYEVTVSRKIYDSIKNSTNGVRL